jgi:hypothetical protein
MKALALAAAVAAGVICSAGTADAQFRSRGSYVYTYPTYTAPVYTAPYTYVAPSGVVTSSYTPSVSISPFGTVVSSGGTYYDSTILSTPNYSNYYSSYPSYYSGGYYGSYYRGRGWRW